MSQFELPSRIYFYPLLAVAKRRHGATDASTSCSSSGGTNVVSNEIESKRHSCEQCARLGCIFEDDLFQADDPQSTWVYSLTTPVQCLTLHRKLKFMCAFLILFCLVHQGELFHRHLSSYLSSSRMLLFQGRQRLVLFQCPWPGVENQTSFRTYTLQSIKSKRILNSIESHDGLSLHHFDAIESENDQLHCHRSIWLHVAFAR